MWTEQHRRIYQRFERRYPSDMTDSEWARLEPLIPPAKPGGRPRETICAKGIVMSGWRPLIRGEGPTARKSTLRNRFSL
jgi:hypothetical protein